MKKYLFALYFLVNNVALFSQGLSDNSLYIPPSPNAANLNRYVSTPVNLYTGTPEINLPIVNIQGRNLSVPVSLSYHASGIKVQDVASWVGLGWSLNAGGVISRVVRGIPDEKADGFCGTNDIGEKAYGAIYQYYVDRVASSVWDSEPDLFYFNFLGKVGMFVLDETGRAVTLPYSNIKIQPAICPLGSGKWVLTDIDGVQYTFGIDANARETTSSKVSGSSKTESYISAWYLSEIKNPDGEILSFSYVTGESISYKYYLQNSSTQIYHSGAIGPGGCLGSPTTTTTNSNIEITVSQPVYLNSITTQLGKISFLTSAGRTDLAGGRKLSTIQVYDLNNNEIESYKLEHSYFLSDNCDDDSCERLKLNQVVNTSKGNYSKLFSFEYDATNLPPRSSHQIDHWGYYNSNSYSSKIPMVDETSNSCNTILPGADRSADSIKSRANILTKIKLPTGGEKTFIYEANKYLDGLGNIKIAGGVRIRILKNCPNANNCLQERFYYNKYNNPLLSSGSITETPIYHHETHYAQPFSSNTYLFRQSQSLANLFDLNGHHIGYSNVKKSTDGNGFTWSFFTDLISNEDWLPNQYEYYFVNEEGGTSHGEVGPSLPSVGFPFTPKISKAWERGILLEEQSYSENKKLLSSKKFKYKFDLSIIKSVPGIIVARDGYDYFRGYFRVGNYFSHSQPYILENTIVTNYDQSTLVGENTSRSSVVTEYNTDLSTLLVTQTTSYNEAMPNFKTITKTKYVTHADYAIDNLCLQQNFTCVSVCHGNSFCLAACAGAYQNCLNGAVPNSDISALVELKNRNQLNTPVEIQNLIQEGATNKLTSAVVYKYNWEGSGTNRFIKPKEIWGLKQPLDPLAFSTSKTNANGYFEIDPKLRKLHRYDLYDQTAGNLLQQTSQDGTVSTYQWGFNNSLVTQTTVNPGASQQQSSYVYQPLIGLSQTTDANGRNSHFEYDRLNRLNIIRDHDNNIVSRYRYHYSGDMDNAIDFDYLTYSSSATENVIQFIAKTSGEPGTTLTWDFNLGTVLENAASSQLQTYATPGFYTVKLVSNHPEYPPATVSKTIRIVPPATAQITSPTTGTSRTVCGNHTTTCDVSTAGGDCTYAWEYNNSGWGNGDYLPIGTNSSTLNFTGTGVQNSSSSIRCKITDAGGNSRYSNYITIFHYCTGQPGPGDCPPGQVWNSRLGRCELPASECGEGCFPNGKGECDCQ